MAFARGRGQWGKLYFGSVRFFKNLILLAVIIMILVPTVFAFSYHSDVAYLEKQVSVLNNRLEDLKDPDLRVSDDQDDPQAVTVEAPAYQSLFPDFYAPQPYSANVRETETIYLTFDDGPSDVTDRILNTLAEKDVKGTFFVIGRTSEEDRARIRRMADEGHTVGMHTYGHDYTSMYSSVEAYLTDMYDIYSLILEETGTAPSVFRFAGGSVNGYNSGIYQELIAEMIRRGFVPFDWNISAEDATSRGKTAGEIQETIVGQASRVRRGIVLMHDSGAKGTTAEALGPTIDALRDMGFKFESLKHDTMPVLFGYSS